MSKFRLHKNFWHVAIPVAITATLIYLAVKMNNAPRHVMPVTDNPIKPAGYSNSDGLDYSGLADQIYNAEEGCSADYGTVLSVFKQLNTLSDFQALTNAFGVRNYNPCWATHPIDRFLGDDQYVNLDRYLTTNLEYDQMMEINDIISSLTS